MPPLRLAAALALALIAVAAPTRADDWKAARKAFQKALKSEDWKDRRDAYADLGYHDSDAAAEALLDAMEKEDNPAVVVAGIKVLGAMRSDGAQAVFRDALEEAKGVTRLHVLLALDAQDAPGLDEALRGVARGKDAPAAAQAAMALGRRQVLDALPDLLALLQHKDPRVRLGAARGLVGLATPPRPAAEPNKPPPPQPPAPAALGAPEVLSALVEALEPEGTARGAVLTALERITGQTYGLDLAAWKALAGGQDPAQITAVSPALPHVFGIPIHGERIVVVLDRSTRMDDRHPFRKEERLEALCRVPGGRDIMWLRMRRCREFIGAHVKRLLEDLPKGTKVELVRFHTTVDTTFGKLASLGAGQRKAAGAVLDDLQVGEGINAYEALRTALDIAGKKDKQAWKSGPDEIVFVTVNVPTKGEIIDPDVLAAAIGLEARLRMVTIHTIGVDTHAYEMLRSIAAQTGGIYRDYHE